MDGISRSRGWDKDIPHGVLPMEQLVLSDKWARKYYLTREKDKKRTAARSVMTIVHVIGILK